MTTAEKRLSKKKNRQRAGKHTGFDHVPGERCPVCKPGSRQGMTASAVIRDEAASVPMTMTDVQWTRQKVGFEPSQVNQMLAGLTHLMTRGAGKSQRVIRRGRRGH